MRVLAVWLLLSVLIPCPAIGKETNNERKDRCISAMRQRTAALAAQDWPALERHAKSYLKNCKGAFDDENLAEAYAQLSIATVALSRPYDSLATAEACIETDYPHSSCHIQKAVALQKLNRFEEAKKALSIAIKIITHNIENTQRDLARPQDPLDRELSETRLEEFNAQLDHAQSFQESIYLQEAIDRE